MSKDTDMFDFVHTIFMTFGSCYGYCEVCGQSHPGCGGSKFKKGKCPDDCCGDEDTFSITHDWTGRQVGECCFEKIFRPLKTFLDGKRCSILEYFSREVEKEKQGARDAEKLLEKC